MLLILIATIGVLLSDLITLVGVIDIVFGEIDK
jgi:NADH:ubiquinone oxidoreductase subunit D